MLCNNCGTNNSVEVTFCVNCGAALNNTTAQNNYDTPRYSQFEYNQAQYSQNPYNQNPYNQPYAYQNPYTGYPQNQNPGIGFAIAGMVCGIVSFFCFAYILGILGIVFGAVSRSKGCKSGMAIAGIVCGILGIVLWILTQILLFW